MEGSNDLLITRDWLAIERTKLANERTFLAYFRTSLAFMGGGLSILQIEFFENIRSYGWFLLLISPFILAFGLVRLIVVRKRIRRYYKTQVAANAT